MTGRKRREKGAYGSVNPRMREIGQNRKKERRNGKDVKKRVKDYLTLITGDVGEFHPNSSQLFVQPLKVVPQLSIAKLMVLN